jgi:hypothetical protein
MSRTSDVLKNKNKVEKARKARRKNEINSLRDSSAFKAKLYDELKHIEIIFEDEHVDAVKIAVPDRSLAQFNAAIYSEDLAGYDIQQVADQPNVFYIRRRYISF